MSETQGALSLATIVHRLLVHPRGWRKDQLMAELGIAERTYRKYRQVLRTQFRPWMHRGRTLLEEVREGDARYLRLAPPSDDALPEVTALIGRLTAFRLARELFASLGDGRLTQALEEAFQGFLQRQRGRRLGVLTRLQQDLDRLIHYVPDAPKDYRDKQDLLETLLRGLVFCRRLQVVYRSAARGEDVTYALEPLTLSYWRGGLYLFARYAGQERVYNFAVDRIHAAALLDEHFTYPSEKRYHPERFTREAFGIFFQDRGAQRARHQVELCFQPVPWLTTYLQERRWHPSQRFEPLPDGRLRMGFEVGSLEEVEPWVRGFGPNVEVLGPQALRDALAPRGDGAPRRKKQRPRA